MYGTGLYFAGVGALRTDGGTMFPASAGYAGYRERGGTHVCQHLWRRSRRHPYRRIQYQPNDIGMRKARLLSPPPGGPHNQPYDPRGRLRFRECPGQLCQSLDDVEPRPVGHLPGRCWAAHRRPAALVRSARRTSHCSRSIAADNWHTGHPSERGGNSRWLLSP